MKAVTSHLLARVFTFARTGALKKKKKRTGYVPGTERKWSEAASRINFQPCWINNRLSTLKYEQRSRNRAGIPARPKTGLIQKSPARPQTAEKRGIVNVSKLEQLWQKFYRATGNHDTRRAFHFSPIALSHPVFFLSGFYIMRSSVNPRRSSHCRFAEIAPKRRASARPHRSGRCARRTRCVTPQNYITWPLV